MKKIDYSCPLPEQKLVQRFKSLFNSLEKGQSATLLALPYSGRTSNLQYVVSNKNLLKKLSFNLQNKVVSLVDIDKTNGTYESFMSEIIESLTQKDISTDIFKDTYLLNKDLLKVINNLTKTKEIILILTLNGKSLSFSEDIDRLVVQIQKATNKFKVTVLWSIDTEVYRKYIKSHPSSTFGQNLFYFSTFDKDETEYNIKRILISKSVEKFEYLEKSFEITGGIAGLFHSYANIGDVKLYNQELIQKIFRKLNEEIKNSKHLISKLITDYATELIMEECNNSINYKSIKLLSNPTAQEINILNSMLQNNNPVSRDEIAQILWGKSWNMKYSDWAIDKSISRLRKKILGNEIRILTIKNFGYQLFK